MNVLIIEDEPNASKLLLRMLVEIDPSIKVVGALESVQASIQWFNENLPPDLVFMDVQLADGRSFSIFEKATVNCPVMFTTAYDEFALEAFKVHALDYLLKPIKKKDLVEAIARFQKMSVVRDMASLAEQTEAPVLTKRFMIRYGDRIKVVEPNEVAYFFAMEKNTFLRTHEGKDLPMDQSLGQLEPQLDPKMFFRLNRQLLVQFNSIDEMLVYSKARVKVKLKPAYEHDAVVSSERSAQFKRWLEGQ